MGLIKLALLAGAGTYAVKKISEHKKGQQQNGCGGQCQNQHQQQGPYNSQNRDMSEQKFPARNQPDEKQRYYDFEPDYSQKRQPEVSQKSLPSYPQEQQEQQQQQQQQTSWPREKQEYQRNY